MRLMSDEQQMQVGSRGPVVCAVLAGGIGGGVLIALLAGMPIRWVTVLGVLVPGASVATALIAVTMGWIFMAFGRQHRRPAGMAGAVAAMALAIVELLTLMFVMIHAGGAAGLGL
jgi:hypothetical protein